MMFLYNVYIALLVIILAVNVLRAYYFLLIILVVCFTSTILYTSVFVILFHFHAKIGGFFKQTFGIPRSFQRKFFRVTGYVFACLILGLSIYGPWKFVSLAN